ncbi:Zinc finger protein [Plakobranchus ocellatus]|uniref:Zinc finger protein n=1 Tax=Plakobranchus ocellatus TaxID=259542 RepID=A0AAV4DZT4_9GAST|nr:Zinc finger protein [Plakobranchus ocellatus]
MCHQNLKKGVVSRIPVEKVPLVDVPLEEALSDQGSQFMSGCMRKVCRHLGIKQRVTPPYNDLVERFNECFYHGKCFTYLGYSSRPDGVYQCTIVNNALFPYRLASRNYD